jgi:hypothetical protein
MAPSRAVVAISVFDRFAWNKKRMNTPPIPLGGKRGAGDDWPAKQTPA